MRVIVVADDVYRVQTARSVCQWSESSAARGRFDQQPAATAISSGNDGGYEYQRPLCGLCGSGRVVHADPVEPIFVAVLGNDSLEIAAIAARTPNAIAQRMPQDVLVTELPHMLYRGDTPLHLAAAGLRYDAARALLAAGTPVDAVNRRGATALHYACDPRPSSATWDPAAQRRVIELLDSYGAAVDRTDRGGVTALHRAVRARSPAAVAALLSAGADPRAPTQKTGSTALHLAVAPTGASGTANTGGLQIEIVRMLLAAGATMADVDRNGVAVVDRIQSQTLRRALAAGHF